jgi:tetratricopeptide (TPR) repeat protein
MTDNSRLTKKDLLVAAVFGVRSYFVWQEAKASNSLWPSLNTAREILQSPGQVDDARLVNVEQSISAFVNMHPKAAAAVYAHYYLGSIAFARRNYDISIAQYKAALDLGKDRGVMRFLARQGLAQALEAKGDFQAAIAAYRDASTAAPGDLKFQSKLGEARVAAQMGRAADAAAIYREIMTANPDAATKAFVETKIARLQ